MATILVADDDQLLRAILRDQLERAGYAVVEAGDGMAAMGIALDERPDVLVLDVMMPLARGLEVVRRVRRQEDWRPAILMISARTRVADRLNAMEAGADAYFEKPFGPDELLQAIGRLIAEAAPARYIDVLGPLWATFAIWQLAEDAFARRRPGQTREAQTGKLFTRLVTSGKGRAAWSVSPYGSPGRTPRFEWGDAVRALMRDSVEIAPEVIDLTPADALAAVGRAGDESLRLHQAGDEPQDALPGFWYDALTRAVVVPAPVSPPIPELAPAVLAAWRDRLTLVLDAQDTPDAIIDQWRKVLLGLLSPPRTVPADPPTAARSHPRGPAAGSESRQLARR